MAAKTNWVTEPLSPYRLAGIMTEAVGSFIRPQAIYGATRANAETGESRLATHLNETGHQVVTPEDANAYIQAFLDRQAAKATKAAEEAETEVEETNEASVS